MKDVVVKFNVTGTVSPAVQVAFEDFFAKIEAAGLSIEGIGGGIKNPR